MEEWAKFEYDENKKITVRKMDNGYTIFNATDKASDGSYPDQFASIALSDSEVKRLIKFLETKA